MTKSKDSEIIKYLESIQTIAPPSSKDYYQWLLANGKIYESLAVINEKYEYMTKTSNMKECFKNSLLAAITHDDLKYVEGYYVTENFGFPLDHAFNANEQNEIIDFTAIVSGAKVVEYFGVETDMKHVQKFLNSKYNGITSYLQWYYQNIIKKDKI